MGRAAGPGSPISFQCAARRKDKWKYDGPNWRDEPKHEVKRTGKTKSRSGSRALGQRNMHESHEYICSCGHRGWSTHRGILSCPLLPTIGAMVVTKDDKREWPYDLDATVVEITIDGQLVAEAVIDGDAGRLRMRGVRYQYEDPEGFNRNTGLRLDTSHTGDRVVQLDRPL